MKGVEQVFQEFTELAAGPVLARSRAKLEQLEKQVAELEARLLNN